MPFRKKQLVIGRKYAYFYHIVTLCMLITNFSGAFDGIKMLCHVLSCTHFAVKLRTQEIVIYASILFIVFCHTEDKRLD